MSCGIEPYTFILISPIARPMVALARKPCPIATVLLLMPIRFAMSPLTSTSTPTPLVDVLLAWKLYGGSDTACTAATTTGMYSGLQPAITALIATFSAVNSTPRMPSTAMMSDGARPA